MAASTTTDGRVKVLFKPTKNVSILVGAERSRTIRRRIRTPPRSPPANTISFPGDPGGILANGSDDYRQYWAQLDWNLGFGTLTYLPAFRSWTSQTEIQSTIRRWSSTRRSTFRAITSRPRSCDFASNTDSRLTWQVGAFYYLNTLSDSNLGCRSARRAAEPHQSRLQPPHGRKGDLCARGVRRADLLARG